MNRTTFFFIGTEAELIKVFPVMIECRKRGLTVYIIASGQNSIADSRIMQTIDFHVDLELSRESEIKKSAPGLARWFLYTYHKAENMIRSRFCDIDFTKAFLLVHGDTVSTLMGASIGKKMGMNVCHIEAGLRSHHLLNPFPEEIDRLLTSRIARLHFAPGDTPFKNLKNAKGTVINTQQNTLLDSLKFSAKIPVKSNITKILSMDYFVFVMHRQENLINRTFVCDVVREIVHAARKRKCVIILHKITGNAFVKYHLIDDLRNNKNIILQPRVDYFDFMKLLQNSAYVITDGGSNQEELFYMNKPCLILRKTTERTEGLGINARLFNGKISDIRRFMHTVATASSGESFFHKGEPSRIIVDALLRQ